MSTYDGPTMHGTYVWERVGGIGTGVCGHPLASYEITFTNGFNDPTIIVSNMPTGGSFQSGSTFTIPNTIPQLQGYTFQGWKNLATNTILNPGDTITITGNVTLEAQWIINDTITPPIIDPEVPNAGHNGLTNLSSIYWFILIGAIASSFFVGKKLLTERRLSKSL